MAKVSIRPTIRRSSPNKDGGYNIKIRIMGARHTDAYISTRFNIDSEKNWNGSEVVRTPGAPEINRQLLLLTADYVRRLDRLGNAELTAQQAKSFLESPEGSGDSLKEYGERMIESFRFQGRDSYARNLEYTVRYFCECFGEETRLSDITAAYLERFAHYLRTPLLGAGRKVLRKGMSETTVNIRMTHLKAILNSAVDNEVVEYRVFPFRRYRMPEKAVRDICISREELSRLRDASFDGPYARRHSLARDLFMLSFYLGGINLTDLVDADVSGDTLTFVRKKTAAKKQGEKRVSLTIQPEAREIIGRYVTEEGRLDFGYGYKYEYLRSYITKGLNRIGEEMGFENRLMYYSARKTFCQFGFELGIPLYILEYAIGQTIKDASSRPIFNYIKIMRAQADEAIRRIIDYSLGKG